MPEHVISLPLDAEVLLNTHVLVIPTVSPSTKVASSIAHVALVVPS